MAAVDHLGEQFITSTHLQSMQSNDFPAFDVGQLHRHIANASYHDYDWDRLHGEMDKHGFTAPVRIESPDDEDLHFGHTGTLLNGHHRAVAAMERGALLIPAKEGWNDAHEDEDHSFRHTKAQTQAQKPHWFSGPHRTPRPPRPKPEIPGQMSML